MGEVYRARDTRLGRNVAIKVLPADRLTDESRRRRFVQEARAASALNHPNIVTIHEIESADGADFIVHRDLKPAKVVVTPEGLDFSLAKLMAPEETSDERDMATEETSERFLGRPGTIAGTPGYMSPEQATGARVDARSDIFAFGSLLYEMVTGRRAFAHEADGGNSPRRGPRRGFA